MITTWCDIRQSFPNRQKGAKRYFPGPKGAERDDQARVPWLQIPPRSGFSDWEEKRAISDFRHAVFVNEILFRSLQARRGRNRRAGPPNRPPAPGPPPLIPCACGCEHHLLWREGAPAPRSSAGQWLRSTVGAQNFARGLQVVGQVLSTDPDLLCEAGCKIHAMGTLVGQGSGQNPIDGRLRPQKCPPHVLEAKALPGVAPPGLPPGFRRLPFRAHAACPVPRPPVRHQSCISAPTR